MLRRSRTFSSIFTDWLELSLWIEKSPALRTRKLQRKARKQPNPRQESKPPTIRKKSEIGIYESNNGVRGPRFLYIRRGHNDGDIIHRQQSASDQRDRPGRFSPRFRHFRHHLRHHHGLQQSRRWPRSRYLLDYVLINFELIIIMYGILFIEFFFFKFLVANQGFSLQYWVRFCLYRDFIIHELRIMRTRDTKAFLSIIYLLFELISYSMYRSPHKLYFVFFFFLGILIFIFVWIIFVNIGY